MAELAVVKKQKWTEKLKQHTLKSLVFWVLAGITLGVLLGHLRPDIAVNGKLEFIIPGESQFVINGENQTYVESDKDIVISGQNLTLLIPTKDKKLKEKFEGMIISQNADKIVIANENQAISLEKNSEAKLEAVISEQTRLGGIFVLQDGITYFIAILKWLVGPIIFLTIVIGIIGLENLKKVGSIGLKAFIYFEIVSTFALAIGIMTGNLLSPGKGMNVDVSTIDASSVNAYTVFCEGEQQKIGVLSEVTSILKNALPVSYVPSSNGIFTFKKERVETDSFYARLGAVNGKAEKCGTTKGWIVPDPVTPFLKAKTLQVLVMALSLAILISAFGNRLREKILRPLEYLQGICFSFLKIFMWFSPFAAFCAMAYLIGRFGIESLINMGGLLLVMLLSCLLFIFGILGIIMSFFKINIFKFMYYIYKEVLIVFATSSSESALAPLMKRLEQAGVGKGVTGLVVPTGYSFNLDCTNIYLALSIIFLSQATGVELSIGKQLAILAILMVTSKGAVGVTGSGFIVLAATLQAVPNYGIPAAAVAILLGVDKFMSEMRAVGNLCGNAVAAVVVGAWDKQIDMKKFKHTLDHPEEIKSVI